LTFLAWPSELILKKWELLSMENVKTNRLTLRSFIPDDWQDLLEYLSDRSTFKYEPGNPIDEAEARAIAEQRSRTDDFVAVVLKDSGKLVGHLSFSPIDDAELRTWELGYIFNPRYQRRGYATEATIAMVRYAFEKLDVHRIVANCNPENVASWKVLERAGFRREGLLRKNIYFRRTDGGLPRWTDTLEYAVLETDVLL
jgi:[ribosomal protein S5]-alanine N-acetyltransferase